METEGEKDFRSKSSEETWKNYEKKTKYLTINQENTRVVQRCIYKLDGLHNVKKK